MSPLDVHRIAPTWPRIRIAISDTAGTVTFADHNPIAVAGRTIDDTRESTIRTATAITSRYGSPLHVEADEPGAVYRFVLHPDGTTTATPSTPKRRRLLRQRDH